MNILIRVDANIHMGSGHVMRCLTLANKLKSSDASVEFVCIDQPGNFIGHIEAQGYVVHRLNCDSSYDGWLPWSENEDFEKVQSLFSEPSYDWVIVDHYGLSSTWHSLTRQLTKHILVIDDLANRNYDADLLLDQNLGRTAENYEGKVHGQVLAGTSYTLLRDEFLNARAQAKTRTSLKRLMISLGGVDEFNYTHQIIECIAEKLDGLFTQIDVVLGATSPHVDSIRSAVTKFNQTNVSVLHGISNVAEVMMHADLAIGAAGTTSWERCCLGLPTIMMELAPNQRTAVVALEAQGVGIRLKVEDIAVELVHQIQMLAHDHSRLSAMSRKAATLVDGNGVTRVVNAMKEVNEQ
ncbi:MULTISPECIES: UDP-2,4-diacetamido-2,4,6-trideoxy-beta-L-altropyranose hydrolase [Gammaproteobacteria]|uniref:UDP-2,4-diacetamido-2,4, 6-trideoxy-beta-L-altropyranose hydrolase n=1 Tax=Gammaproteobacteria TaxID=1236 RepID=UPI000DD06BFF|nr:MULTISPECIES: UDP-2,4-diacetamido-2,4,6-trideoxy-beta-L-altropyranose hydrolase [Gammaproteobacteria]RTE86816.1 UDP-2,4-diacetamido-2,4,6-trideoxy-beta-L-altropyranose hydrolase [Aliidiomarina sp. B3213]TCZ93395.1 UDP-2,4-diacetamido-2,4,6-trideoxy-beta-L-altropyranose hydrolase [Lysobacter sp. N42]